ncbi:MAG: pentapeptide repeat-containing protein [Ectothiorhodospiraceae bacterium]|jgi:hypothetical protein|nr:pentapeptide repeat-containing protein [Ectothiorhodospiraceae bacterium]
MTEPQPQEERLWYVRRGDGNARGPYPTRVISSYILLGRIADGDELSTDQTEWRPVADHPDLVPLEVKNAHEPGGQERLAQARLREDERLRDRRRSADADTLNRERRGPDRRSPESQEVVQHRAQRAALLMSSEDEAMQLRRWWPVLVVFVVLMIAGMWWVIGLREGEVQTAAPDCQAAAAPGVNWARCQKTAANLAGARLDGANLDSADLRRARLTGASLKGANLDYVDLRGADLKGTNLANASLRGARLGSAVMIDTNLSGADLGYADLRGAFVQGLHLDGTKLDRAIWIDGRECADGSVGRCL